MSLFSVFEIAVTLIPTLCRAPTETYVMCIKCLGRMHTRHSEAKQTLAASAVMLSSSFHVDESDEKMKTPPVHDDNALTPDVTAQHNG